MSLAPGFLLAAGRARRTTRAGFGGVAVAALGGGEAVVEVAAEPGGTALSLDVVPGALEGDSLLVIPSQSPARSVFGGGGVGG